MSNRIPAPGAFVPIPTFPLAFIIMRSLFAVLNRIELLYIEFVDDVLSPIRSILLFAAVCADKRKNPEFSVVFTPLISFVLCPEASVGITAVGSIAREINFILGLSLNDVTEVVMWVVPVISRFDFTALCVVVSTKFLFILTAPFKFVRPITETSPAELMTIELLCGLLVPV